VRNLLFSILEKELGDLEKGRDGLRYLKLGDCCTRITDGTHLTPRFFATGIPFVFVKNIVDHQIDFQTDKFIDEATYAELTSRCPIEVGDVLYTTVGVTYGQAAPVETSRPFAFQRHIAHLKPDGAIVCPRYLAAVMNLPRVKRQADRFVRGAAQPTLNLKELREMVIPVPPMETQRCLEQKQQMSARLLNRALEASENHDALFNALVQRAFRGEL
jgi:type I restriction enzyme S subunit